MRGLRIVQTNLCKNTLLLAASVSPNSTPGGGSGLGVFSLFFFSFFGGFSAAASLPPSVGGGFSGLMVEAASVVSPTDTAPDSTGGSAGSGGAGSVGGSG